MRLSRNPPFPTGGDRLPGTRPADNFDRILYLLREATGESFSKYLPSVVQRHIRKRMMLHKMILERKGKREIGRILQLKSEIR